MIDKNYFSFSTSTLAIPLYFVLSLWLVYWFEVKNGFNFNSFGIFPRTLKGFRGVLFSPFIHGDIKHLYHNSIPLFVLFFCLLYFYKKVALKVFLYGVLLTGLFTWIIARPSYHIGASGIVYLLFSFIFFSGIIRRNFRLVAVSLMVIFLYGGMVWYVLPVKEGISWEGHLSGFLVGLILAFVYRSRGPQMYKYDWEKDNYQPDAFDQRFDDAGNFIPGETPEEISRENDDVR